VYIVYYLVNNIRKRRSRWCVVRVDFSPSLLPLSSRVSSVGEGFLHFDNPEIREGKQNGGIISALLEHRDKRLEMDYFLLRGQSACGGTFHN